MDINQLIAIIKKKLLNQIEIDNILIEDKSFLHKNHPGNQQNKFHLKISLTSHLIALALATQPISLADA